MNQNLEQTASNTSSIDTLQAKLDTISDDIFKRFRTHCRLTHFHILALDEARFSAFLLFKHKNDQQRYEGNINGWRDKLTECVHQSLRGEGIEGQGRLAIEFQVESEEALKEEMRARSKNIPTEEDFARADILDAEENRDLDRVSQNVKQRFASRCPLHNLYLFVDSEADFRMYVFFKTNADIAKCNANGITEAIENAVYEELERCGRGRRGDIVVAFEWDSDENVEKNFDGDYLLRLR